MDSSVLKQPDIETIIGKQLRGIAQETGIILPTVICDFNDLMNHSPPLRNGQDYEEASQRAISLLRCYYNQNYQYKPNKEVVD